MSMGSGLSYLIHEYECQKHILLIITSINEQVVFQILVYLGNHNLKIKVKLSNLEVQCAILTRAVP